MLSPRITSFHLDTIFSRCPTDRYSTRLWWRLPSSHATTLAQFAPYTETRRHPPNTTLRHRIASEIGDSQPPSLSCCNPSLQVPGTTTGRPPVYSTWLASPSHPLSLPGLIGGTCMQPRANGSDTLQTPQSDSSEELDQVLLANSACSSSCQKLRVKSSKNDRVDSKAEDTSLRRVHPSRPSVPCTRPGSSRAPVPLARICLSSGSSRCTQQGQYAADLRQLKNSAERDSWP